MIDKLNTLPEGGQLPHEQAADMASRVEEVVVASSEVKAALAAMGIKDDYELTA